MQINQEPIVKRMLLLCLNVADIIVRYDLEKHYYDELKHHRKATGKTEIKDENLKRLWKNAALEGFSGEKAARRLIFLCYEHDENTPMQDILML